MDYLIGQIILAAFQDGRALSGLLPCDGRTLQIQQYNALYAVIGPYFSGSGNSVTTFNLPNLTAPVASNGSSNPPSLTYYICCEGIYPNFS